MRVSSAPKPESDLSDEEQEVYNMVKTRRGATGLLPLDHVLFHSFPLAQGWHTFFAAIRNQTSLPTDVIELVICRVALQCGARIPWNAYLANLRGREGWDDEKLCVVRERYPVSQGALTDTQWALLRYADAMTTRVVVDEALFRDVRASGFQERQIVELTATIAGYNCVSRFLVALDIEG